MRPKLEPGERLETRTRPARLARWRRYLAPLLLVAAGAFTVAAPAAWLDRVAVLGLTDLGARLVTAALGVLLTTAAAWFLERRPVLTLAVGTLGITLGGNLLSGPAVGAPLALVGLAWLAVLEVGRLLGGIVLTDRRVLLPRPLRRTFGLGYEELHVVHLTREDDPHGSLILETEHGTVTVKDLPGHTPLAARIRARMDRAPVRPEPASIAEARGRIQQILAGQRPGEG